MKHFKCQNSRNTLTFQVSGHACVGNVVRQLLQLYKEINNNLKKKTFPPQNKLRDEIQAGTDRSVYGLTQNMRNVQSPMEKRQSLSSSKPTLVFIFFPTFYFFNDDLFSFYTDTIQSKSQIHFKIFNRLSQTLQFPQNIGWTIKALFHILLICMYFLQSTIVNKIQYKIYSSLYFRQSVHDRKAIMQEFIISVPNLN